MSILVSCECGKKYRVKDDDAGKQITCRGCGQKMLIPQSEPEVLQLQLNVPPPDSSDTYDIDHEEAYPTHSSAEDFNISKEDEADTPKRILFNETTKEEGICFRCDAEGRSRAYYFIAATFEGEETYDYGDVVEVKKIYSNVNKFGIFLCRPCALEMWKKNYVMFSIIFGFGPMALVLVVMMIIGIAAPSAFGKAVIWLILLMLGLGGVAAWGLVKSTSRKLQREVMEQLVVQMVKPQMRQLGDTFFTLTEAREQFERV